MAHHYLIEYNESDRADYMAVVASMAGADGDVSSEEILALRALCVHFLLGPDARGRVMAATTPGSENMGEALCRLAGTGLKHSLVLDLAAMAWQDGVLHEVEANEVRRLAGEMGIDGSQANALMVLAEKVQKDDHPDQALKDLEASGVPLSSVAVSATLYGLSLAGVAGAKEALQAV